MNEVDLNALTERLEAIRDRLSERNIMSYSGSIAPDKKTQALLDVIEVVEGLIEHLHRRE